MAEAGADSGAARASLPGTLQYGRVRPVFARARDIRVTPTTGFVSYTSGNEITWNLPTGNDMWLDQRNSYISCDFAVNSSATNIGVYSTVGNASYIPGSFTGTKQWLLLDGTVGVSTGQTQQIPATTAFRVRVRTDGDSTAFIREWKTYVNGVLVEDFERPNLLMPLFADVHSDQYDSQLRLAAAGNSGIVHAASSGSQKVGGITINGLDMLGSQGMSTTAANVVGGSPGYMPNTMNNERFIARSNCNPYGTVAALGNYSALIAVSSSSGVASGATEAKDLPAVGFTPGFKYYAGNKAGTGGPNANRMLGMDNLPTLGEMQNTDKWLYQGLAINPPSSVVGTGTDRMLPLAFFQSVRCVWTLEYAHLALQVTAASTLENMTNGDDHVFPIWANYLNGAIQYKLGQLFWYMRIIELDGDVLSFVADAYASGGVPRFLFPMEQWIHKYTSVAAGTSSATIPFNFNITSAKGVIVILRMNTSELHGSNSTMASYALSDRFGGFHMESWQLIINGRSFPEYGPVQHYNAASALTGANADGRLKGCDSLYKALGAVAGNIAAHTPGRITLNDWFGEGTYPLIWTGGSGNALTASLDFAGTQTATTDTLVYNMMGGPSGAFFIGLPLEPADITEGSTTRAGVRLSAANDVSMQYTLRTDAGHGIANASDIPAIRVDMFILADTEFAFEQGAVTKIGAS